jgi:hypothetical protein
MRVSQCCEQNSQIVTSQSPKPEKPSHMSPQDNLEVFPLEPFQGASASM